jgi:hypothetical protein
LIEPQPVEVGLRITAALDYARNSTEEIRPHYLWHLEKITEAVTLDDLTTAELVSLTALLVPAHARVLDGRAAPDKGTTGRVLHLVGNSAG